MTSPIPGIGGVLLPERYIASQLFDDQGSGVPVGTSARIDRWWRTVRCGPASALRAIFDEIAMPLFALLGFSAHDAVFDGAWCRTRLVTPRGTPVALLVTTWAHRPSSRWADLARHATQIGAAWGFVLAPPFLSLVPTTGHASRRSVDFVLPTLVDRGATAYLAGIAHAQRFDPHPQPGSRTIAALLARASAFQDDVRADLQQGVERAWRTLTPAIDHARSDTHRAPAGPSSADEALTLIYRILFLLFAESRHLVPGQGTLYARSYAMGPLCREAIDGEATGLWDTLAATSRLSRFGCRTADLRVTAFNGALFARAAAPVLEQRRRRTRDRHDGRDDALRQALVALGSRPSRAGRETIHYRDLGVEQLGAVYERILDLDPDHSPTTRDRPIRTASQHSRLRRETGTFYTPRPLAEYVVRRTLAPLVDGAPADRILDLRVLDPAMGSGAFLVAACRYLAAAYEDALVDEGRLAPDDVDDHARAGMRRLIAERCLAGVDSNPTAVHLARLSMWLTTLARDRPLGFLDHRLRTGDSLVGAWPADLGRTRLRAARSTGALPLFDAAGLDDAVSAAASPIAAMLRRPDDTVADVHAKARLWQRFTSDQSPLHRWRLAAHVWCARWFAEDDVPGEAETRALIDAITRADRTLSTPHVARRLRQAASVAAAHRFFHWPLEFPDVFFDAGGHASPTAGFDAVIGNPPWEMLRRDAGDAGARATALFRYVRHAGQYPSCGGGHLNLYQAFVDRTLALVRPGGRMGLVLPWSIATDDGAAALRQRLFEETRIDLVVGLDNADGLFPIHRGLRMAVVAATQGGVTSHLRAVFGVRRRDDLDALPARGVEGAPAVTMSTADVQRAGGPTRRIPDIRQPRDLDLLLTLSRRFAPLSSTHGWQMAFGRELNATDIRTERRTGTTDGVPVVEGKHLAPFVVDVASATRLPVEAVYRRLPRRRLDHARVGYRDVSAVGNRLTLIAAVIPGGMVTTHTVFTSKTPIGPFARHFLCACLNSWVLNLVVRLLMGGHVTTTLAESLPVPVWRGDDGDRRIAAIARVCASRRAPEGIQAMLQALVARRFELTRQEFAHVLERSPLVPDDERREAQQCFDRLESGLTDLRRQVRRAAEPLP